MARVRSVIRLSTSVGSRLPVSASMSANTGTAPQYEIDQAVEIHEKGVVMTSSPGPTPAAKRARWRAAVPELTPTQWRLETYDAKDVSKSINGGPEDVPVLVDDLGHGSCQILSQRSVQSTQIEKRNLHFKAEFWPVPASPDTRQRLLQGQRPL